MKTTHSDPKMVDRLTEKYGFDINKVKTPLFSFVFQGNAESSASRVGNYLVLMLIYLGGAFHWSWVLNYGNIRHKFYDWSKFFEYYEILQKAVVEWSIPYFMPHYHKGTNQFLAIPETDLSPSIFLLNFIDVKEFFWVQCLILYSIGFLGSLWLKRKFKWSLFVFLTFFLIFNFNGHIVSHLAVGHWPWISYFLFPYFIVWVLSMMEGEISLRHGGGLALIVSGMLLLGGLHPMVWSVIFLGLICLGNPRYIKPAAFGVVIGLILSSYRMIPAIITFFGYKNPFFYGFPSIPVWVESMIVVKDFKGIFGPVNGMVDLMGWWEVDHYIGVLGLLMILYFGVYHRRTSSGPDVPDPYRELNMPLVVMTILSFSFLYGLITQLPIPFVTVERASSRFFIVPLLFLLTLSCIDMQNMFNRWSPDWKAMMLFLTALLFEGSILLAHSQVWQVRLIELRTLEVNFGLVGTESEWARSMEGFYVPAVLTGYTVSFVALVLFVFWWFFGKNNTPASN